MAQRFYVSNFSFCIVIIYSLLSDFREFICCWIRELAQSRSWRVFQRHSRCYMPPLSHATAKTPWERDRCWMWWCFSRCQHGRWRWIYRLILCKASRPPDMIYLKAIWWQRFASAFHVKMSFYSHNIIISFLARPGIAIFADQRIQEMNAKPALYTSEEQQHHHLLNYWRISGA